MTMSQTKNPQNSSYYAQPHSGQPHFGRPWLRIIRVTLGPLEEWRGLAQGEVVRFESNGTPSGLRVECSLKKNIMGMPDYSQIRIYNLAPDTRNAIKGGLTKITVEAGCAVSSCATSVGAGVGAGVGSGSENSELHIAFQGSIAGVETQRVGTDMITVISALPGYGALVRGISSKSYGPGMTVRDVVKDMASDLPGLTVADSAIEGLLGCIGSGGWAFAGSTRDGLTKLAEEYGFSWHVDNGQFKAIDDTAVFGGILELCSQKNNTNYSNNVMGDGGSNVYSGSSPSSGYSRKTGDMGGSENGDIVVTSGPGIGSNGSGGSGGNKNDAGSYGPAGVLSSVTASLTGPLQPTAGVRIEAPYIPGIIIGSTVRVRSDSSPTLNGDYRILTADIKLDTYSPQGWNALIYAQKVRVANVQPLTDGPNSWLELDFRDEENNPVPVRALISQGNTFIERTIKGPTLILALDSSPVTVKIKGENLYYPAINGSKRAGQRQDTKYDEPQKASTLSNAENGGDPNNPVQNYTKKQKGGTLRQTEKEYILVKTSSLLNPAPPAKAFGPGGKKSLMFVDKEYNLLVNHSYVLEIKALLKEYIAVAACPYNETEANKLLFPAQAVRMMRWLQGGSSNFLSPEEGYNSLITKRGHKLTILLMNVPTEPDIKKYTDKQLEAIKSSCAAYEVELIEINDLPALIDYINNSDRENYLVEELTFFAHGRPSPAFGTPPNDGDTYGITLGEKTSHERELNFNYEQGVKLQSAAFSADAEIKSFACRTGTGVFKPSRAELLPPFGLPGAVELDWKTEISQAQVMANAIRRVVWAYVCRSEYGDTWGSSDDRARFECCKLPEPKYDDDFLFCREFGKLVEERKKSIVNIGANWNEQGAVRSVKAGTTPSSAPKDYKMLTPS